MASLDEFQRELHQWLEDFKAFGETYYDVLRLGHDAADFIIDAAYKALVKRYHPDSTEGAGLSHAERTEKTSRLNRAYQTLHDPRLRDGYDLFLARLAQVAEEAAREEEEAAHPRLELSPTSYSDPDAIPVGVRIRLPLRVRNTGGSCSPPYFHILTPRDAGHPRPDRGSWLSLEQPPTFIPGPEWQEVTLVLDTSRLRPDQQYSEAVYVEFCGQVETCRITFHTAKPAEPSRSAPGPAPIHATIPRNAAPQPTPIHAHRSRQPLLLVGAAALALVGLIGIAFALASSGGHRSTQASSRVVQQSSQVSSQSAPPAQAATSIVTSVVATQAAVHTAPPAPTAPPDTPAGTVLDLGQTWRQDGIQVTLQPAKITSCPNGNLPCVSFGISIKNNRTQGFPWTLGADKFTAVDNRGNKLEVLSPKFDTIIDPGKTAEYGTGGLAGPQVILTNYSTALTDVTVTVSDLGTITAAAWRIPVNQQQPVSSSSDTPAGAVLDVGQRWQQGGIQVVLRDAKIGSCPNGSDPCLLLGVTITNHRTQGIPWTLDTGEFTAVDNHGNRLQVLSPRFDTIIDPGKTAEYGTGGLSGPQVILTNYTSLSAVTLTVDNGDGSPAVAVKPRSRNTAVLPA